jgi:hypothetical protein
MNSGCQDRQWRVEDASFCNLQVLLGLGYSVTRQGEGRGGPSSYLLYANPGAMLDPDLTRAAVGVSYSFTVAYGALSNVTESCGARSHCSI